MSAPSVPEGTSRPRGRAGRHRWSESEELESARDDALFFRGQTLGIVRHFFEIASQVGRLPSILGRELFRAKVSHHAIPSFEEQAVFVHDVERALARLGEQDAEVMALVGLFHFSLDDVAAMLGRSRTAVAVRFSGSVDRLAEIFLETGLLREDRPDRRLRRFEDEAPTTPQLGALPKRPTASVRVDTHYAVGASPTTQLRVAVRSGA